MGRSTVAPVHIAATDSRLHEARGLSGSVAYRAERDRSRWFVMFVLVTGGTGFVGSNAIVALVAAGHRVRVLARSPERVAPALAPLGLDP
jgi:NADPH:quinone reductase-like Zn-dependent oxidoreductase